ncbi:hypothetical protein GCM10010174_30300 [Kutzneria viridogrisea]
MGGGYSIDFDDADKFIKALQDQKDALGDTMTGTASRLNIASPGHDDYSNAFGSMGKQLVDAHREWNQAKQDELQSLIDKVTAAVKKYKETEHDNTMRS